jgi:hypothetical protein
MQGAEDGQRRGRPALDIGYGKTSPHHTVILAFNFLGRSAT